MSSFHFAVGEFKRSRVFFSTTASVKLSTKSLKWFVKAKLFLWKEIGEEPEARNIPEIKELIPPQTGCIKLRTYLYTAVTSGFASQFKFKIRVISCSQILCHFTGPYFWMWSIPVVQWEEKMQYKCNYRSPCVRAYGFRNAGNFCLWTPE